jgi:hypothetical protein
MKRKHMLWFTGLALAALLGWHFLWSARTPDGQPPLTYLGPDNNTSQFNHAFNDSAGGVRLVLLLSPT